MDTGEKVWIAKSSLVFLKHVEEHYIREEKL